MKLRFFSRYLFVVLLFCSLSAKPQTPAAAVLAWIQEVGQLADLTTDFDAETFEPGWFEKVELRSETDEFDFERQRYSVRVQPKMPHIRRAEKALQSSLRSRLSTLGLKQQREGYEIGLARLAQHAAYTAELEILEALVGNQTQFITAGKIRLREPNYDIDNLLDAEDELDDLNLAIQRISARLELLSIPIDATLLVTLNEIPALLATLENETVVNLSSTSEIAVLQAELNLEKAENNAFIDFLQADFRGDQDLLREKFSLGASIQLPRSKKHIRAIDELNIELEEEARKAQIASAQTKRLLSAGIEEIRSDVAAYTDRAASIANRKQKRERLIAVYRTSSESQPEDLLKLQRRTLRERLQLEDEAADIMELYFELVSLCTPMTEQSIQRYVLR